MRRYLVSAVLFLAVMVSQSLAAPCLYDGEPVFCQWDATGCWQLNSTGTDGPSTCATQGGYCPALWLGGTQGAGLCSAFGNSEIASPDYTLLAEVSDPNQGYCDYGAPNEYGDGGCWDATVSECEAANGTFYTLAEGPAHGCPGPYEGGGGDDPDPNFSPTGILWDVTTQVNKAGGGWNSYVEPVAGSSIVPGKPLTTDAALGAALLAVNGAVTFIIDDGADYPSGAVALAFQTAGAPANISSASGIRVTYTLTASGGTAPAASVKILPSDAALTGDNNHKYPLEASTTSTTVNIPFTSFAQEPYWGEVYPLADLLQAAKGFQFHMNGSGSSTLTISKIEWIAGSSVCPFANFKNGKANAVRASYTKSGVSINWNAGSKISNGTISLVNIKGVTVASSKVRSNSNNISAKLASKAALPAGMYFVRINARDVNGKQIVQQVPVNIVK